MISLPADADDYSDLVRRAQGGEEVDFRRMRLAYLGSKAGERTRSLIGRLEELRAALHEATRSADKDRQLVAQRVRETAVALLSLEYIDLEGHRTLRIACKTLGDDECATRHKQVEFGLLASIAHSGDGLACKSAWEVVSVAEEYFSLRALDLQAGRQAVVSEGGHTCDRMEATDRQGVAHTFYFNVDRLFEQYDKRMKTDR